MTRVVRQRIWVRRDEVLDAVEAYEGARRAFYGYTYRTLPSGSWLPAVRWGSWGGRGGRGRCAGGPSTPSGSACSSSDAPTLARSTITSFGKPSATRAVDS